MAKLIDSLINKAAETGLPDEPVLPAGFLKNILDTADRIPQKGRAATYSKHVHVSSLAGDFCARQYAITRHEKLSLFESLTGGHKVTFAIGRAVETHIRDGIISQYGRQNIYAKWTCECGKTAFQGTWRPINCACGKEIDIFNEADIQDDDFGVKGHPDLIFRYKNRLFVVEIKSINKPAWEELEAPLPSHIKQALMYPYLLGKEAKNVSTTVVYIYCTKDFKFGSPYKEYHVDASEEHHVAQRQNLLEQAKEVKDYVEGGKTPERICKSIASPLAKKCPVAMRCFNTYKDEVR